MTAPPQAAATDATAPAASGRATAPAAIYDLGYKRYVGTRRPQRTRYRVIVMNVVRMAWRGWWKTKIWLVVASMTCVVAGAYMYVAQNRLFKTLLNRGRHVTWADALIPMSFGWSTWIAFILATTVAAGVVASDLRAGAFEFYFCRPVRPVDYVLGKIGGVALLIGAVLVGGPLLLALFRLGLSDSSGELLHALALVPKAVAIGAAATLAFSTIPLAFGAIAGSARHAIAAWVAFYVLVGGITVGVAMATGVPAVAAIGLHASVMALAAHLFGLHLAGPRAEAPLWAALVSLGAYTALSVAVIYWRVSRAERSGLGGG